MCLKNTIFFKYQAAGNDFLLIDDRLLCFLEIEEKWVRNKEAIASLCHRKRGIGADGLILLQPHFQADFTMRIFNSDGIEAEGCGNGLRCLLRFLHELGFQEEKAYLIQMGNRIVEVFLHEGLPTGKLKDKVEVLDIAGLHFVHSGAPHAVVFVEDVTKVDVLLEGRRLRWDPLFSPHGTNVNFVSQCQDGKISVRTFEKGVEGETLSCGTGAVAVAAVGKQKQGWTLPALLQFPGGTLSVWEESGAYFLKGPAEKVFQGRIKI